MQYHSSALDTFLAHYPEKVLQTLNDCAGSQGLDIHLVGGGLRDLMMNVAPVELDFAINSGAAAFIKEVRSRLGTGAVVILGDEENDTARLVLEDLTLDVSGYRKGATTIAEDLSRRDFTINSLAVPLDDLVQPDKEVAPVDPLGGFNDLTAGVIRACPNCFDDDPLRLLRAYRFSAQLDFVIERETLKQIRDKTILIIDIAAERIASELDLILATPRAYKAIRAMQDADLLRYLIPELYDGAGVEQPPYHHLDVMDHNLATLDYTERILARPENYFPRGHHLLSEIVADRGAKVVLKWAALFHDIGKPAAKKVNGEKPGRITFYNHDEQGALIAEAIAERLRWSKNRWRRVSSLIAMHMHPFHLNNVVRNDESLSRRAMHKICKRAGDDLFPLFILAMADSLAGEGPEKPAQIEEQLEQLLLDLAAFVKETLKPVVSGPKLLTGHDLIDTFKLTSGPEIGLLLEEVEAAAVEGRIRTRDEALAWVEEQLARR